MELVIFDLDGVIVSTDQYHYEAWKALSDKHNLLFNYEMNHMLRGVSRGECLKIILDLNSRIVDSIEFAQMLEEKNNLYKEKLNQLTEKDILPGVPALLKDLKEHNIPVAIGSSSKNTPAILKGIGLSENFDVIVDGNSIINSKPDPEVFLKCAVKMNISPEKCVVIEDAKAGIDAALAADMYAIGVGEENLPGAHKMIKNLKNLSYKSILEDKVRTQYE